MTRSPCTRPGHGLPTRRYGRRRWTRVTRRPEVYEYFLEVDLVREVLEVWSAWRNGQIPTTNEACTAVIYYAEHDAYQPAADSHGEQ